jgi:hypothetical protein
MSSTECSFLIDQFDCLSLHNTETPFQIECEISDTESLIDQTFEAFQEFLAEMDVEVVEMES